MPLGIDDTVFKRQRAIISSMTAAERKNPDILKASRKKRVAAGSGTKVEEINKLLKMHRQMADMMKAMGKGKGMFGKMMGGMGLPGMGGGMPQIDPAALERLAKSGSLPGGMPGLPQGMSGLPGGMPGLPGLGGPKLPGIGGSPRSAGKETITRRLRPIPISSKSPSQAKASLEQKEDPKMSLKIRLTRAGAKKRPFYRVVIADSRFPARRPLHRGGRHLQPDPRQGPTRSASPWRRSGSSIG